MKKLFLSFVAVLIGSMTANAVTYNKALLQHNDEVTLFDADKVQDAVDAAVDGDIIYLTLGTFQPFNVTKKITIRGAGETSIINGSVNINIPNSPTLTSPVLDMLTVTGSVTVGSAVSNLLIRQCKLSSSLSLNGAISGGALEKCQIGSVSFSGTINNLTIDRCYITVGLTLSSTIESMTVLNTKLYKVSANYDATNNTTFVNCNFFQLYPNYFSGTIINSIIQGPYVSDIANYTLNSTVIINSIINTSSNHPSSYTNTNYSNCFVVGSSSVTQNCYISNLGKQYVSTSCTCNPTSSYVGTDGTIVGVYGGDTPYDDNMLVAKVPKVTSSDLDLDLEQKKLNVTLTVSPQ